MESRVKIFSKTLIVKIAMNSVSKITIAFYDIASSKRQNCLSIECVLMAKTKVIVGVQLPNKIEMFYDPTGNENQIQPLAEEYGKTVYNNDIKCDSHYFARVALEEKYKTKFKVEKDPIPKNIDSDSLLFESRFESGNLAKATRITDTYYELRFQCLNIYFIIRPKHSKIKM